jgi:hypothetical protein
VLLLLLMTQPTGFTNSSSVQTILISSKLLNLLLQSKKEKPKPELKLEDVRSVLAGKSRAGHTAEVRDLLQKYGATKLSAIDPANYEALMKDAEAIGNGK